MFEFLKISQLHKEVLYEVVKKEKIPTNLNATTLATIFDTWKSQYKDIIFDPFESPRKDTINQNLPLHIKIDVLGKEVKGVLGNIGLDLNICSKLWI